jgi:hypothetical protein
MARTARCLRAGIVASAGKGRICSGVLVSENARFENVRRMELRPIPDREFARWQWCSIRFSERALRGPGTRRGWNFEPALLPRLKRRKFSPSLEYYGEIESVTVPPRAQPEVHQLFAGGDLRVSPDVAVNMGMGFDLAARGPGLVLKRRFEWHWGSHGPWAYHAPLVQSSVPACRREAHCKKIARNGAAFSSPARRTRQLDIRQYR